MGIKNRKMESFFVRLGRYFGLDRSLLAKKIFSEYVKIQMWNKHGLYETTIQGSRMCLDLSEPLTTRDLYKKKIHSYSVTACFYNEIQDGMVVFDIGANIGYYSLLVAKITNLNSKIFAFEPSRRSTHLLQKNITLNSYENISVIQSAVGDKNGKGVLYLDPHSSVDDKIFKTPEKRDSYEIEIVTVDDFIDKLKVFPDFIKIDVQGAEYLVFNGMIKLLQSKRPLKIVSEFSSRQSQSKIEIFRKLLLFMNQLGFSAYYLQEPADSIDVKDRDYYLKHIKKKIYDFTEFKFSQFDEIDILFVR